MLDVVVTPDEVIRINCAVGSGRSNFDEAARFASDGVEDSLMNWVGLVAVLAVGVVPIVIMQRNRTKPLKKRREVDGCCRVEEQIGGADAVDVGALIVVQALRSLAKNRLTKAGDKSFTKTFTKTRKQYVEDPTRARECCLGRELFTCGLTKACFCGGEPVRRPRLDAATAVDSHRCENHFRDNSENMTNACVLWFFCIASSGLMNAFHAHRDLLAPLDRR
ncbi:unnamed protein product [Phytophthora fragariaefolia]|uniref:Unnamed protein product n=1 Tax=Phytophthora fragariaefolia TaxID=1490495 RepID=A0A9W6XIZ7_9STRA|nr:unnamed protein product [Phytophthora fragariaefolia]